MLKATPTFLNKAFIDSRLCPCTQLTTSINYTKKCASLSLAAAESSRWTSWPGRCTPTGPASLPTKPASQWVATTRAWPAAMPSCKAHNAVLVCPLVPGKYITYRNAVRKGLNHGHRQLLLLPLLILQPFHSSLDFVWDNPGELVPEETFTHSHLSWSSIIPYLLPPSTASSLFNLCA